MTRQRLPRNVATLGAVSFLTDVSSEMIYPLLPKFLSATLGASGTAIGGIEGAAQAVASLLKIASGRLSDRLPRRKPLVVVGYALASIARPLVAAATSATHVLGVRVADRVGKGLRESPRDALLADSVSASDRGRAFGFHRAADHAGAVVGPLLAFALLKWVLAPDAFRTVFWLAAIPAALSVVVLVVGVREEPRERSRRASGDTGDAALGRGFVAYLAVVLLFTLGNCTDAFLLLRASQLGVPDPMLPLLWAALHVVKSVSSTPAGTLSDRIGRKPLVIAGWAWFAVVYLGLALASAPWHAWALFVAYGLFFGLTEGVEKALVADLAPASRRGTAFGWFHGVVGIGALPASLVFGVLWDADSIGPSGAFVYGAALALVAAVGLAVLVPRARRA